MSSTPSSPHDSRPTAAFIDFISKSKQPGVDGQGKKCHFITPADLARYWTRKHVEEVVYALHKPIRVPVDVIEARYVRVFSLLVYIDRAPMLEEFATRNLSDGFFPLQKFPAYWPDDSPMHGELYDLVKESQWLFFPLVINQGSLCNRQLRTRHILPIVERDVIKDTDEVAVSKIKVPWSCQRVIEDSQLQGPKTSHAVFVLKTYKLGGEQVLYDGELEAWVALADLWSDNILMCWGGFVQSGTYNLVFEYANGGSLGDFLRQHNPPASAEELVRFWSNLTNVLHGLHRYHQHKQVGTGTLGGIHQNLHMQNVLLADFDRRAEMRFSFTPKLADFGNSHVRVAPAKTEIMDYPGQARYGNQSCEPPENSDLHLGGRDHQELNGGPDTVTPRADIWALGTILSQAVVWSALGSDGMREYFDMCMREGGVDSMGAFHDGFNALQAVRTMHERVVAERKEFDTVTPHIIEVIEQCMLVRAAERLTAKQLYSKFQQILPSDGENNAMAPLKTISGSAKVIEPAITLDEVEKWRLARIRKGPREMPVDAALCALHKNLRGRRYVFLLDDSASMSSCSARIRQTLITIADLASHISAAPVELVLASDPTLKPHRIDQGEEKLAKLVDKLPFENIPELMEAALARAVGQILEPHLIRATTATKGIGRLFNRRQAQPAPINLFVLTDAKWRGRGRGMELPLRRLVSFMNKRNLDRSMAMVQLLHVGGYATGLRVLEEVVEDVGGPAGYDDIVDARTQHDSVHDIFLGSATRRGEGLDVWQ